MNRIKENFKEILLEMEEDGYAYPLRVICLMYLIIPFIALAISQELYDKLYDRYQESNLVFGLYITFTALIWGLLIWGLLLLM